MLKCLAQDLFFTRPISIPLRRLNYHSVLALESTPLPDPELENAQFSTFQLPSEFHNSPNQYPTHNFEILWFSSKLCITDSTNWVEKNDGNEISVTNERLRWYSQELQNCASRGSLNLGKTIHGQVIKNGIDPDSHLWNSLINVYSKCGCFIYAHQVLDEMPERDVVSWTALIAGLVTQGYSSDSIYIFCEMRKEGVRPNEHTVNSVLKGCSMSLNSDFGKQLHGEIIKVGIFQDVFVGSALVDLYARCGEMEIADKIFLDMPEKNSVSWNSLLNGYAQMGDGGEVLELFCRMTESEMKFCGFTLSTVLKGCTNSFKLREAQTVHSMAIKVGCELHEYLSCSILHMYSTFGLANDAIKAFRMIKNPNVVAWSDMISCLNQQGQNREAAEFFSRMRHEDVRPNQFTLAILVRVASDLGDLHYGEGIHGCICKYGFEFDSLVSSALVALYMKNGAVERSLRVFEAIHCRDSASWNVLLSGFHGIGTFDQGPIIFRQMLLEGFKPDIYTFITILCCCSSLSNIDFGKQVHTHIVKHCLNGDSHVGTALIDLYTKSRCSEDANTILVRLNERDLVSWTVMIQNYAHNGQWGEVFKCFSQMQREGVRPNAFTLSSCLSGCLGLATLGYGRQLHCLVIKTGMSGETYVSTSLVDMYSQCRCIHDAEAIFKNMTKRNLVSQNAIICGYSRNGEGEKALEVLRLMLDEGQIPDEVTLIGVLSACSHMGMIEEGKEHFESMSRVYGITPTIEHHACMVNILCRAGIFYEVEKFMEVMNLTQNALIWKTVLWASKMHGNVEFGQKAAKKLFMLEPETDYNYILLSDIYAAKGMWHDVAKVRAFMSKKGIKKDPGCCWVEIDDQAHMFFAQDDLNPKIKEICQQLGKLGRLEWTRIA